ncbi:threonylcarbamoyl-AMP synthase [Patescibacteria group bacterium]|nr:threonylcarbamoyl-AMP synthase [Patescibacteria group bacterium]
MKVLKINPQNLNSTIAEAVLVLKSGGIVAHPTDTVWGLACDAANPKAIQKIHALKNSDPAKPLLLNLPSKNYLGKIGRKLCRAKILAREFWPGSLSLLVAAKLTSEISRGKSKIGVRLPDHRLSNALAKKFGAPLITTSANLSGRKVAKNADAVAKIFGNKVDLILDDGSESKNLPSTLVDVSGSEVKLIREGAIPFKKILQTLSSHS